MKIYPDHKHIELMPGVTATVTTNCPDTIIEALTELAKKVLDNENRA